jgi:hypothetical protein
MDDKLRDALDVLIERVESKSNELAELKRMVNALARETGTGSIYPDAETAGGSNGAAQPIRPDLFYGKSPIVAAREYLELRGRAVPVEEILQALAKGGFDFEAQKWTEETRLRNLAISLSKNSVIFHKLPNGTYGLVKFYPDVQAEKKQRKTGTANGAPTNGAATAPESENT